MADGEITLKLDAETVRKLQRAAAEAGVSMETKGAEILADGLADAEGWAIVAERLEEFDRTGEARPANEVLAEFRARIEARLAGRS
ncbi:plasmid stability protein [Caulobacter ginsengisoli]|uniref:Plasmid stability protein n=1 Tax=Caulobacter ginsengisoli TaxID=400775 RepID=A0ABU0IMD6_9CAUL|nr:hypothetical protein [Caulobacter ginsengisoli]MDQ0463176.1 plasmid stability protein [Caulobacter ginsengisoli]